MSDGFIANGILAFAHQLAVGSAGESALSLAQSRRWLDAQGQATSEGRELLQALAAQRETRTAWRFLA